MNILTRAPFQPKLSSEAAEQISTRAQTGGRDVDVDGDATASATRVRAISAARREGGGFILCGTRCRRMYTNTCTVNVITA